MTDPIKVLIADDHQVVRQGLCTFLELHEDIVVVGEADNGATAVEMAVSLAPDVVLMDLVMPKMDGVTATREIKACVANTHVIALTSFAEDAQVFPAIQAGASSYLLKDVSPEELVDAIRAVHRGETRLHPDIARKLLDQVAHPPAAPSSATSDLTEREREVVSLVAQGCSNQEIANRLIISSKTVKTHISNILSKLGLEDRTQLAIFALKNGFVGRK
ncbi:MAG: response regulator [Acidobacteriota bacterium]